MRSSSVGLALPACHRLRYRHRPARTPPTIRAQLKRVSVIRIPMRIAKGLYALTVSSSREIISDVLPSTPLPPADPGGHIGTRHFPIGVRVMVSQGGSGTTRVFSACGSGTAHQGGYRTARGAALYPAAERRSRYAWDGPYRRSRAGARSTKPQGFPLRRALVPDIASPPQTIRG